MANTTTTTVGTGPDHLVLRISENAYKGDAQFTVTVDGEPVGGVLTAHVEHVGGKTGIFDISGDWLPGEHDVVVHFLNDLNAGKPRADRNLYLDGANYNGDELIGVATSIKTSAASQDAVFTFIDAAPTPPVDTHGDLNVLIRGQSNAQLFVVNGGAAALEADLERMLGVNVHVLARYEQADNTIFSATAFMDWDTDGEQASLLRYINAQTADIRDNPTITLWMHNEYDQKNTSLTTAQWVGEVRADASLVRSALHQTEQTTPYLFVPIKYPYGDLTTISNGMNQLAGDAGFHAARSDEALQSNILMDGGPEPGYGSSHMGTQDALTLGHELADDIASLYHSIG